MLARCFFILVLLDLLAESGTDTSSSVITQDVQSKNISSGIPVVEFICEVSEASSCNWKVNEEFGASHVTVRDVLMITDSLQKDSKYDANDNTEIICIMKVPTEPATLLNGTRVQCLPLVATGNFKFEELEGNTARMLLQGQYASVGDIHFSNDSFAIEARWNRPYHLDGVPPTNYNCTVSILSTGEDLNVTVDHENTSCSFMLEEDMICDVLVIEVMAYNQWIEGDMERAYWSLGGSVRPSSIVSMVAYADGPYFTLSVEYEVVGVCLGLVQQVVVMATCSSWMDSNVWNVSNTSAIENGVTLNATIGGVPEDQHCFFVISLWLATMESVNTTMRLFSTFDLKEVTVMPIDDQHDRNLCVTCTLREGSDARGCLVSLQLHQGNETKPSNFIVGEDEHCLVQEQGLYTVEVFDYHANGNLSKLPAYSQENLRIPRPPRPPFTPEPATTPPAEPTTVSGLSTPEIAGLTVGVVVFVLFMLVAIAGLAYLYYKRSGNVHEENVNEENVHEENVHEHPTATGNIAMSSLPEQGRASEVEEDGLPGAETSLTKKPENGNHDIQENDSDERGVPLPLERETKTIARNIETDCSSTGPDPVPSPTKKPEDDREKTALITCTSPEGEPKVTVEVTQECRFGEGDVHASSHPKKIARTQSIKSRHSKISKEEIVFVFIIMILGLILMGVVFYVIFAPAPQCEPAGNATLDRKSVQERIRGSHEVIADGSPFRKQSQDDHLQECLQQSSHYDSSRVTIFYHRSEQDKNELLSCVQGRYHQLPSEGCTENITQWTSVKPDGKPNNEV